VDLEALFANTNPLGCPIREYKLLEPEVLTPFSSDLFAVEMSQVMGVARSEDGSPVIVGPRIKTTLVITSPKLGSQSAFVVEAATAKGILATKTFKIEFESPIEIASKTRPPELVGVEVDAKIKAAFEVKEADQVEGDSGLIVVYSSPRVKDKEGHAYKVAFEGLDESLFTTSATDSGFYILMNQNVVTAGQAGKYPVKLILSDDVAPR
jgi:hypothetical protein